MSQFTELFEVILNTSKITQADASARMGISAQYLSDIKQGKRSPTPEIIELLTNVFNLTQKQSTELHEAAARDKGFKV